MSRWRKSVRVLLIQSYLGRKGVADQLVYPIGLSCIATALENAGHTPWIVDLNVGEDDPFVRLRREITDFQPDFVGVSQRNIDSTTRNVFTLAPRRVLAEGRQRPLVLPGHGPAERRAGAGRRR